MPKKGQLTPRAPIGDVQDGDSLYYHLQRYLNHLAERHYSPRTLASRDTLLRYFILWCDERGLLRPQEITLPILERYQGYLFHYRKANGEPLSLRSQHVRLSPLRGWFKWLTRQRYIRYNPAAELELPRLDKRLPKHVLSAREAEAVLAQPDTRTPSGLRDRAILEVLYSTGMRRMELIGLHCHDIDSERGTVMIRQGKGRKDRMIPIGERALAWIEKYRADVRPDLLTAPDEGTLFLTHQGEPFTPNRLTQLVRNTIDAAKLGKRGSCHLLRHTMATLMLEGGADIRFIQAMLGHAKLDTTQIYTQVSIRALKAIHTATHPGRLRKARSGSDPDAQPQPEPEPDISATALLDALDAEREDENEDGAGDPDACV